MKLPTTQLKCEKWSSGYTLSVISGGQWFDSTCMHIVAGGVMTTASIVSMQMNRRSNGQ